MYFLKAINFLQEIRLKRRALIQEKIRKNTKVRTIQKLYRNLTKNLDVLDIPILRSQKLLTLYYQSVNSILLIEEKKKIANAIKNSGDYQRIILKFDFFFMKITRIQRNFKKYLVVRNERMKNLIKY